MVIEHSTKQYVIDDHTAEAEALVKAPYQSVSDLWSKKSVFKVLVGENTNLVHPSQEGMSGWSAPSFDNALISMPPMSSHATIEDQLNCYTLATMVATVIIRTMLILDTSPELKWYHSIAVPMPPKRFHQAYHGLWWAKTGFLASVSCSVKKVDNLQYISSYHPGNCLL